MQSHTAVYCQGIQHAWQMPHQNGNAGCVLELRGFEVSTKLQICLHRALSSPPSSQDDDEALPALALLSSTQSSTSECKTSNACLHRALSSPPSSQDDDEPLPAGLAAALAPESPSDSDAKLDLPAPEPQSQSQSQLLDGGAVDAEEEVEQSAGQVRHKSQTPKILALICHSPVSRIWW